jgi:toxin-antitoxin system PIN domain toxin
MWLADSNIWLALAVPNHRFNPDAKRWLNRLAGGDVVAFCRSTQQSFLRLLTTPDVLKPYQLPPASNVDAWRVYAELLADERFTFLAEPVGIEEPWKQFSVRSNPSPKLWMDAYLAAFATAGNMRFVTTDTGFRQFAGLDLHVIGT